MTTPEQKHTCCEDVREPGIWPHYHTCNKTAKVQHEGKWYCGIHDPAKKQARREVADVRFKADMEKRRAEHEAINRVTGSCEWTEDENGLLDTDCGQIFTLNDGNPEDNSMSFCCFCGKRLEFVKFDPAKPL